MPGYDYVLFIYCFFFFCCAVNELVLKIAVSISGVLTVRRGSAQICQRPDL